MNATTDPQKRTALAPEDYSGPVTLMNQFHVAVGRDDAFVALWTATSEYFRAQPGFRSLRLHRALLDDTTYRFVNVANWESIEQFRAAHATAEFREVVGQPAWAEFPSSPALFEIVVEAQR
jgi:heme-degrading monooxygenase HmoA